MATLIGVDETQQQDVQDVKHKIFEQVEKILSGESSNKFRSLFKGTKGFIIQHAKKEGVLGEDVKDFLELYPTTFKNADVQKANADVQEAIMTSMEPVTLPNLDWGYEKHDGIQTNVFVSLPDVLTLHLNRFHKPKSGAKTVKLTSTKIAVTPRLALKTSDGEDHAYKLHSVVFHKGKTPESGHYFCYINIKGEWWKFNDGEVEKVVPVDFGFDVNDQGHGTYLMYLRDTSCSAVQKKRRRYKEDIVEEALNWFLKDENICKHSWGRKTVKLSATEAVVLPPLTLNKRLGTIIEDYLKAFRFRGKKNQISRSSATRVLKAITSGHILNQADDDDADAPVDPEDAEVYRQHDQNKDQTIRKDLVAFCVRKVKVLLKNRDGSPGTSPEDAGSSSSSSNHASKGVSKTSTLPGPLFTFIQENSHLTPRRCLKAAQKDPGLNSILSSDVNMPKKFKTRVTNVRRPPRSSQNKRDSTSDSDSAASLRKSDP